MLIEPPPATAVASQPFCDGARLHTRWGAAAASAVAAVADVAAEDVDVAAAADVAVAAATASAAAADAVAAPAAAPEPGHYNYFMREFYTAWHAIHGGVRTALVRPAAEICV